MKTQTIANCFRKGGFGVTASEDGTESRNLASQEGNEEQALPEVVNGDSYTFTTSGKAAEMLL